MTVVAGASSRSTGAGCPSHFVVPNATVIDWSIPNSSLVASRYQHFTRAIFTIVRELMNASISPPGRRVNSGPSAIGQRICGAPLRTILLTAGEVAN